MTEIITAFVSWSIILGGGVIVICLAILLVLKVKRELQKK